MADDILLVAPHWVGDAVMSLGLAQALKAGEPARRIAVLCSAGVAAVYRASPAIDEVIEVAWRHGGLQSRLRWSLARGLRARPGPQRFRTAYILPNSFKTALVPWLARIPERIGYAAEARGWLLTRCWPKPRGTDKPPMLDWYARLAPELIGATTPRPLLQGRQSVLDAVRTRLLLSAEPYLCVAPGAEYGPAKRWPAAYFAAVVAAVLRAHWMGIRQVVLLGGPQDKPLAAAVLHALPAEQQALVRDGAGLTTLDEAIALIGGAAHLLSNDSGLMHVAAALDTPLDAIFGSTDPRHTPPLSPQARVHWLQLACSPCFQRECPLGHTDCLNELSPKRVAAGLLDGTMRTP
ncbi:MAG: lipopolysaccharide heptosyltransferase II [Burkholderiaceae bacterium]